MISSQYLLAALLQSSILNIRSLLFLARNGLISRSKMEERCTDTNLLEKHGKYFDLQLQFCIACLIHPPQRKSAKQQQHMFFMCCCIQVYGVCHTSNREIGRGNHRLNVIFCNPIYSLAHTLFGNIHNLGNLCEMRYCCGDLFWSVIYDRYTSVVDN